MRRDGENYHSSKASTLNNSSFFHGKFKKYSANLGGRSFIIKAQEFHVPELPRVEYVCNQIATFEQEPTMRDYANEFVHLGYQTIVNEFYQNVNLNQTNELIVNSSCIELMKNALIKLISTRYLELFDALQTISN